ncbi:hypothetical protein J437_LFUL000092 [Ladona fulva]|uniref:Uncharacterized protein n=1 Tax=Ladona fulva TaxID=123851 RepID=A0A8K0K6E9_LADFU|nr:hypothetical protein J437_LFUL000092 [Ladona fulva]
MVSTNASPPMAMPVRVPPGHVVQQIVDENGTLRHVILSPTTATLLPLPAHYVSTWSQTPPIASRIKGGFLLYSPGGGNAGGRSLLGIPPHNLQSVALHTSWDHFKAIRSS